MLLSAFVIASFQYADPARVRQHDVLRHRRRVHHRHRGAATRSGADVHLECQGSGVLPRRDIAEAALRHLIWNRREPETARLPDSGLPDITIAPDLSNLPEGYVAVELGSGMEVETTGELRAIRAEAVADDAGDDDPGGTDRPKGK